MFMATIPLIRYARKMYSSNSLTVFIKAGVEKIWLQLSSVGGDWWLSRKTWR